MHEDAQSRVQRRMHETGTPRDKCRCLVGILAGMRRWRTAEGLKDRSTKRTGAGKKYGLLGWLVRTEVGGRTGCKMRDDEECEGE